MIRSELSRRALRGHRRCIVCGYDLRATSDVCPECGMPIASELIRVPLNEARLNREWPASPIAPRVASPGERLAFVHAATTGKQADLLAGQLKARGVWVESRPGSDCTLLLVPAADAERAAAIVTTFALKPSAEKDV